MTCTPYTCSSNTNIEACQNVNLVDILRIHQTRPYYKYSLLQSHTFEFLRHIVETIPKRALSIDFATWDLRSGLRRRNRVTHSFPSGNKPSSATRCFRNISANSRRYAWRIGCPRAVAHLTKYTSADSSAGVKAWF